MIISFLKTLWCYIDIICFLTALGFIIWGCFLIGRVVGIFSIAGALVLTGLATEYISEIGR